MRQNPEISLHDVSQRLIIAETVLPVNADQTDQETAQQVDANNIRIRIVPPNAVEPARVADVRIQPRQSIPGHLPSIPSENRDEVPPVAQHWVPIHPLPEFLEEMIASHHKPTPKTPVKSNARSRLEVLFDTYGAHFTPHLRHFLQFPTLVAAAGEIDENCDVCGLREEFVEALKLDGGQEWPDQGGTTISPIDLYFVGKEEGNPGGFVYNHMNEASAEFLRLAIEATWIAEIPEWDEGDWSTSLNKFEEIWSSDIAKKERKLFKDAALLEFDNLLGHIFRDTVGQYPNFKDSSDASSPTSREWELREYCRFLEMFRESPCVDVQESKLRIRNLKLNAYDFLDWIRNPDTAARPENFPSAEKLAVYSIVHDKVFSTSMASLWEWKSLERHVPEVDQVPSTAKPDIVNLLERSERMAQIMAQTVSRFTLSISQLNDTFTTIEKRLDEWSGSKQEDKAKEILSSEIVTTVSKEIRDAVIVLPKVLADVLGKTGVSEGPSNFSMTEMLVLLRSIDRSLNVVEERKSSVKRRFWQEHQWYKSWGKWVFVGAWWIGIGIGVGVLNWHGTEYRRFKEQAASVSEKLHLATGLACLWVLIGKVFDIIDDELSFFIVFFVVEVAQLLVELAFELKG